MNNFVVLFCAVVLAVFVVSGVSHVSNSIGQQQGIKNYHDTCYYGPPGMIVDEKDKL